MNHTSADVITLNRIKNDMEEWRKLKKLGCLLIDKEGIKNRKRFANIASNKLECIWLSRRIAFIQRRVNCTTYLQYYTALQLQHLGRVTIQDE